MDTSSFSRQTSMRNIFPHIFEVFSMFGEHKGIFTRSQFENIGIIRTLNITFFKGYAKRETDNIKKNQVALNARKKENLSLNLRKHYILPLFNVFC